MFMALGMIEFLFVQPEFLYETTMPRVL